mmetsp:Transcript_10241/g.30835  ORF Transcript_10241/g.30835 Transcript_10241/m.30835 type:complete len:774 (-) Transcript_10241:75-2396(-)
MMDEAAAVAAPAPASLLASADDGEAYAASPDPAEVWPESLGLASPAACDEDEDELDEPEPLLRVNTVTVKGLGLMHNYVPVTDDDAGKRCVVDGFPATNTMRFMGPYALQKLDDVQRCVVQIENPDGEDTVLTEKGLLVRLSRVKLAPDEAILSAPVLKRGGSVKTWKRRYASLDGDGYLRYYADAAKKRPRGRIDIRRDCMDIRFKDEDVGWPSGVTANCRLCILTEQRTYFFCVQTAEAAETWATTIRRVARPLQKRSRTTRSISSQMSQSNFSAISKSAVLTDRYSRTSKSESEVHVEDDIVSPPLPEEADADDAAPRRVRRHFFRAALTNSTQVCKATNKRIGMRTRHMLCTQCRKRYMMTHAPKDRADCVPPAFGTPAAVKRIAPPLWSNLATTVRHTSTGGRVPGLIEDLIATVNSRGIVEGIYRVPGDRQGTSLLIEQYFNDPRRKRLGVYTIRSVHTCASALKQFLRELDEPLLTFDNYDGFIAATKASDLDMRCSAIAAELAKLPLHNFYTLRALIEHLQVIASEVALTRMKISNLAAVFAPTLMACPEGDEAGLRDVMFQMVCVDTVLKLDKSSWDEAQAHVEKAMRVQSASPVPARRSGDNAKSPRGSGSKAASPDSGAASTSVSPAAALVDTTVLDGAAEAAVAPDDTTEEVQCHIDDPESPIPNVPQEDADADEAEPATQAKSSRMRSSSITRRDQQQEVGEILDEARGAGDEDIPGIEGLVVEEGHAEGALFPGLEAFSLDAGDHATLTLVTPRKKKTR